jgi:hypothetical protein
MRNNVSLADLFDDQQHLKPLTALPAPVAAEIASFDVMRTTVRRNGTATVTEELVRVTLKNRATALVRRHRRRGVIIRQMTRTYSG